MQPTLQSERLTLRPVHADDVDALWALWTDPGVRRFLWDDREIDRATAEGTVHDCLALAERGIGLWIISGRSAPDESSGARDLPDDSLLGCAGLFPLGDIVAQGDPSLAGAVEPLVALAPAHWGQGYAVEALRALQRHAAETLSMRELIGVTDLPNVASERMLQRCGFVPLGEVDGPAHRMRTYRWRAGEGGDA